MGHGRRADSLVWRHIASDRRVDGKSAHGSMRQLTHHQRPGSHCAGREAGEVHGGHTPGPTTSATPPLGRPIAAPALSECGGLPAVWLSYRRPKTAIPTSRAAKMADIAIRWDLMALSRDQKAVSAFRRGGHGSIRGRGSSNMVGIIEPRRLIITTLSCLSGCKT